MSSVFSICNIKYFLLSLVVLFVLLIVMKLDFKKIYDQAVLNTIKENFTVNVDNLQNYRPSKDNNKDTGNTVAIFNDYISDYTNGVWTSGVINQNTGKQIAQGLQLKTNATDFQDIIKSWQAYVDARILTLTVDGSIDPSSINMDAINEINELTEFRNGALRNTTQFLDAWRSSQR